MFCRSFLHIVLTLFTFNQALAQEKKVSANVDGDFTSRYFSLSNEENNTKRIQGALTLEGSLNIGKKFGAHAVIVQTPALGKRFYTIYDFNDAQGSLLPDAHYIQKLYAQFEDEKTKVQVGTIPRATLTKTFQKSHNTNVKTIENGFMGSNAWVDGARISHDISAKDAPAVLVSFTLGSLDELDTSLGKRKNFFDPNYFEAQVNFGDCRSGIYEGSIGIVDGDIFVRTGLEKLMTISNNIALKLYSEGLVNTSNKEVALILGYQTDLLSAFNPSYKDKLKMGMEVAYIGKDIGTRGIMANDAFLPGKRFRLNLSGKVNKSGTINWFAQKDFGQTSIFSVGTKINLQRKRSGS